MDLEREQEVSMIVMNLVAIEEHLAFTIGETGRQEYLAFYNAIRTMRSRYQKKIVSNLDGQNWCVAKHLLCATMHSLEAGIKYGAAGEKKEAMELFESAVETYRSFWLLQKIGGAKK